MSQIKVILSDTQVRARLESPVLKVAIPGTQGPPGPPGTAGSAPEVVAPAGENLSAGRAVVRSAGTFVYFQPTNPGHQGRVVGITKTSASTGQNVTVQTGGVVTDASYNFPADAPVFAGDDGELTQSAPVSLAVVQYIGISLGNTSVLLNINTPFKM